VRMNATGIERSATPSPRTKMRIAAFKASITATVCTKEPVLRVTVGMIAQVA
jgi:hypothetical protein